MYFTYNTTNFITIQYTLWLRKLHYKKYACKISLEIFPNKASAAYPIHLLNKV